MKRGFLLAVVILIGSLLAACGPGAGGKVESDREKLVVKFHQEVVDGGYKVVTTEQLKQWVDAKKPMLIVDTMPLEASYKKNHIPGAKPFELPIKPLTTLDEASKAKFLALLGPDKGRLLVFYCGFPKCGRSHNGALWAVKLGYTNVYRHPGGIVAWMEQGYPVGQVD